MGSFTIKRLVVGAAALLAAALMLSAFLHPSHSHEVKTGGYKIPQDSDTIATGGYKIPQDSDTIARGYLIPAGPVLELLEEIPIKGRAPTTGYRRSMFGRPWTDDVDVELGHNGCDTRNDILHRDLTRVVTDRRGCRVLSGFLHDPYTGKDIPVDRNDGTFILIQIDHIVPLKDAWQKGAQQWDERKRTQFANDPLNLLAVGHQVNKSKRDHDVGGWLPQNKAFRCFYVARVVQVKARYGVWMTQHEHDTALQVLEKCSASG